MANSDYLIAGNDEHGLEPLPTIGKRTPYISQVGRSFYENEFNKEAKRYFLEACARQGFRTLDVKPGNQDLSLTARAQVVNASRKALSTLFCLSLRQRKTMSLANSLDFVLSTLSAIINS